ncbi:hypothetical protein DSN97_10340 [Deferribacteraceae bacterium V6Fe1]|nr:hypothetical protein DSN97_10340 [Deferribacteraceae bacterium V6Fe1]
MKSKILILIMLFGSTLLAVDSEFMKYLNQQMSEYNQFKEERDREFTEFLQKEWKDYQMFKGIPQDETPKPVTIPKIEEQQPLAVKKPSEEAVIPEKIKPPVVVEKPVEVVVPPVVVEDKGISHKFNFYGAEVTLKYDKNMVSDYLNGVSNDEIAKFWEKASKSDFSVLIESVKGAVKSLNLGDWGTVVFVKSASLSICNNDFNRANLLSWFVLAKLGYDVRVGIDGNKIYLLVPSDKKIFGVTYFVLEGKKYYAVDTLETRVFLKTIKTYDGTYPGSKSVLKIDAEKPLLPQNYGVKHLTFTNSGEKYNINLVYDNSYVNFYKLFPQTELNVYEDSGVSQKTAYTLAEELSKIVKGRPVAEAANIILRFVQTAFAYKTDIEQFGYEKYFVPDETIFYPYSDCEDRSILYYYLVKNILGLDVVLLDYPGHVATAIQLKDDIDGDYVIYNNKKYYVADPTYINANIGMTMPIVAKYRPKVVK